MIVESVAETTLLPLKKFFLSNLTELVSLELYL
jgi:hypothetical protein